MAAADYILIPRLKRKAADEIVLRYFQSRSSSYKKIRMSLIEDKNKIESKIAAVISFFEGKKT